ncbi:MFS transporter, partial [Escherichia coli]|uniref:MFS transporter n=2 Tax=Escherichia coli TaxID=562 RepID=UPI002022D6AA
PAYGPQNDVTLKMPAFEWVHVQLHQQKGMISLSPPTICNSASAGVLVGLADGAGYLLTLSNCVKWFPERKGLISAFAIGSYGLGSLGFKFIDTHLLETVGLEKTFVIWGAIVLVMIVFGATLMKDAPKQEVKTSNGVVEKDYTLAESMRKPQYWMLAVMFLTACMSGLYVIGVAKDIAQSLAHLDAISAANAVTVISIANLSGRLVLGILSDKIARIRVITIGQVIALVGMAALLFAPLNAVTFFAAIACVAFNFGGTITVFPSLVSEFFGLNNLAKNYGVIYLGFGIGSICGSIIASLFGGFYVTFYVIFALLILSLALSTTIRQPEQKMLREAHGSL